MQRVRRNLKSWRALGAACALVAAGCASGLGATSAEMAPIPHNHPQASEAQRLLSGHNAERARLGLPPLRWNPALARDAGDWAKTLLERGELEHASHDVRRGSGENLWMGTAGAWNAEGMVEMFLDERRYFRPATFPNVSLTGHWSDVGHYSQIVWRETKEVGCAVDSAKGLDVLVCRYFPAGNVAGQAPY